MAPPTGFVVALPTADRARAHAFFRTGLGLETPGEPAEDGVPEPLTVSVAGATVMLVPTGGFGWVTPGRTTADDSVAECLLTLVTATRADADALMARAVAAGATVVTDTGPQPWGYAGTFADLDGHLWMVQVED